MKLKSLLSLLAISGILFSYTAYADNIILTVYNCPANGGPGTDYATCKKTSSPVYLDFSVNGGTIYWMDPVNNAHFGVNISDANSTVTIYKGTSNTNGTPTGTFCTVKNLIGSSSGGINCFVNKVNDTNYNVLVNY